MKRERERERHTKRKREREGGSPSSSDLSSLITCPEGRGNEGRGRKDGKKKTEAATRRKRKIVRDRIRVT